MAGLIRFQIGHSESIACNRSNSPSASHYQANSSRHLDFPTPELGGLGFVPARAFRYYIVPRWSSSSMEYRRRSFVRLANLDAWAISRPGRELRIDFIAALASIAELSVDHHSSLPVIRMTVLFDQRQRELKHSGSTTSN